MRKMTIGVDFRPALSRATGVGRYFQGLVSGLARLDHENDYVLFSSSWKERAHDESRPENFRLVDRRVPVRVLNALWHRMESPSLDWLVHATLDVAHSPTPLILPSRRARSIVTICDLFFLDHPETTTREIRRDYVNLGFRPGNEGVIKVVVGDLKKLYGNDVNGTSLDEIPMTKTLKDITNMNLLVNVSAGTPGTKEWVLYAATPFGIKMVAGTTGVGAPVLYPYIPNQLAGLLGATRSWGAPTSRSTAIRC